MEQVQRVSYLRCCEYCKHDFVSHKINTRFCSQKCNYLFNNYKAQKEWQKRNGDKIREIQRKAINEYTLSNREKIIARMHDSYFTYKEIVKNARFIYKTKQDRINELL